MSSNLKVNSLVPATGTEIGIGTTGGSIDFRCAATFGGNVTIGGTLTYDEVINIDSIGIVTARSGVIIPDNKALSLGNRVVGSTAGDLRLYHDGSNSYIDEIGAGNLYIRNASDTAIFCQTDGTVKLHYDGSEKLATTSTGVSVTGTVVASGAATLGNGSGLNWGDTSARIRGESGSSGLLRFDTNGGERLRITSDGKLLVGATAATNGSIAEFSKSVAGGGAGCHITVENTSNNSVNNTAGIHLKTATGTAKFFKYQANQTFIQSASGGASELLLQASGAHPMRLYAGDAEKVRIEDTGEVHFYGNQTSAPEGDFGFRWDRNSSVDFTIKNTNNTSVNAGARIKLIANIGNIAMHYVNNGGFYLNNSASGYLHYYTGGTSRLYIDTSGNITINNAGTIGTSNGGVGKRLGIKSDLNNIIIGETTNSSNFGLILESRVTGRSGNARASQIGLGNGVIDFYTANAGAGVTKRMTITANGDVRIGSGTPATFGSGTTVHETYNASTYVANLVTSGTHQLQMIASQTHGATSIGTRSNHNLNLCANDSTKMTITTGGKIGMGAPTTYTDPYRLYLRYFYDASAGYANGLVIDSRPDALTTKHIRFYYALHGSGGGSELGSVTSSNAGSVSYNTSSDYRRKKNDVAITDGIAKVKSLRPIRFNWIEQPDITEEGFFAHEAQEVVPNSVFGAKDAVDKDGNPDYQVMDHSKLVPLLTAALKEAITKIETLEARIATLEAS